MKRKQFLRQAALLSAVVLTAIGVSVYGLWHRGNRDRQGKGAASASVVISAADMAEVPCCVSSPSGNLIVTVRWNENGRIVYSVRNADGQSVLDDSQIGLRTDACDFSEGLSFVRQLSSAVVDETYTNISGKKVPFAIITAKRLGNGKKRMIGMPPR